MEKYLEKKKEGIKKFYIKGKEISNYINNGFYTNGYVYIKDDDLSLIPSEEKIIDEKTDYKKILNKQKLEEKFVDDFKKQNFTKLTLSKSDFTKLNKELKVFKFEQIKIRDGKFALYNKLGRNKWHIKGITDALKGFNLDFDYSMLMDIFYYIDKVSPMEVTFYSNKTYLYVTFISTSKVEIYGRGVILEEPKKVEQLTM